MLLRQAVYRSLAQISPHRLSPAITRGCDHHLQLRSTPGVTTIRQSSASSTFRATDLIVQRIEEHEKQGKQLPEDLEFGKVFTDHMLEVDWTLDKGWGQPLIHPLRNISLHPSAKVFHYAFELFEGMKAFRGVDGKIRLFRPELNAERMQLSAWRQAFPTFDKRELVECIRKLVQVDQDWVPYSTRTSLYIRPTMIGTEPCLGVTRSQAVKLFAFAGPVCSYFKSGFKPVKLLADPQYVRAWEGGVGAYKMGSNYAPTVFVSSQARQKYGCQEVLWLYGKDHLVTEAGAMNIFMFWVNEDGKKELITPPLEKGLILPGVTRLSLLEIARGWDEFKVSEKPFTMKQIIEALEQNRVREMFTSGTACVVCPVSELLYQGTTLEIPTMKNNAELTNRMFKTLTDIQYGHVESSWTLEV